MSTSASNLNRDKMSDLALAGWALEVVPEAVREIRRELQARRRGGLSIQQFRILASLAIEGMTNKQIANRLGTSVAAMSRMVQSLEDEGLVKKSTGIRDRREVAIELSGQGRRLFERSRAEAARGIAQRFAKLSNIEKRDLRQGLEALSRALGRG